MANLKHLASQIDIALTAKQCQQFAAYAEMLQQWNQKINLTAVQEKAAIEKRHFYDSLTCFLMTGDLNASTMIDLGTGAGFPGLPLKIAFPQLKLTLVESVHKKTNFLHAVVSELRLDGVEILAERAEHLGRLADYREQFDWAVARALADMRVLAEYLLPFCCQGGHLLAPKGAAGEEETAAALSAIEKLGGGLPEIQQIMDPEETVTRFLIKIEKVSLTPEGFPRRVGIPSKRPLL